MSASLFGCAFLNNTKLLETAADNATTAAATVKTGEKQAEKAYRPPPSIAFLIYFVKTFQAMAIAFG